MNAQNFLFLNSPEKAQLPFYGQILADMDVSVKGPQDSTKVDVNVTTREKSNIFMELAVPDQSYATPDFIRFVGTDSTNTEVAQGTVNYSVNTTAFNISGEIKVTPETKFNMVIDPANGDKISGSGEGDFTFSFDSQENLNLYGKYVLQEGSYTFTFLNIIKKNFQIEKGSSITWTGDADHGIMDVTALYKTEASRAPLIADQISNLSGPEAQAARNPQPVTVKLFLKGDMEEPDISFDIDVPENSTGVSSSSLVAERINEIKSSPSELNKQVLGVIAFNQFMPYQQLGIQGGASGAGIAAQSVSRVLNSQLNKLTDQIGGIDVQVNVNAGNQLNTSSLNVKASKQISDRLSVSVGGDVNALTQQQPGNSGTVFLGDYMILYRLNDAGTINLKVFSRSQKGFYSDYIQQLSGVSVQHSKQFDSF
jgi:hypothetical protein